MKFSQFCARISKILKWLVANDYFRNIFSDKIPNLFFNIFFFFDQGVVDTRNDA